MRRGVKPQKKKTGSAVVIAIVLNIVVWGGLGLLFEIHKIVVQHHLDVSLITVKAAKFKPVKLPPVKKEVKKSKPKPSVTKKPGAKQKPGPPHPHFMSSAPSKGGSGHGSNTTVQAGGTGTAGQISGNGAKKTVSPPPPPPKPVVKAPEKEKGTPTPLPKPPVQAPPQLHQIPEGVTQSASPLKQIAPVIPESLRRSALTTSVTAEITVSSSGNAKVKLLTSSGNAQIDQIVLNALRKWTWQPAEADGIPYPTTIDYTVQIVVH